MLCRMVWSLWNDDASKSRFSLDGNFNIRLCFAYGNVEIVNGVFFYLYIYIYVYIYIYIYIYIYLYILHLA